MLQTLTKLFSPQPPRTDEVILNGVRMPATAMPDGRLSLEETARVENQVKAVWDALAWVTGAKPLKFQPRVVGRHVIASFRPLQAHEGAYKAILREHRLLQSVLGVHDVDITDHAGLVYVRWPLPGHRRLNLYVDVLGGGVGEQDLGEPGGEWSVPVGLHQLTGNKVWLDLDRYPHWLVSGGTGGGKSTLVRALLASLYQRIAPARWRVMVATSTRKPWLGVDAMDNSWGVHLVRAGDPTVPMAEWLVSEMERRLRVGQDAPALFAVFDDVAGQLSKVPGLAALLARLAPDCRQAGIHLVLITQHAVAEAVGGSVVLANMGARFVGPASSAQAASLGGGRAGSAAATLAPGQMELTAGPHKYILAVPYVAPDALPRTDGLPDEVAPWLVSGSEARPSVVSVAAPPSEFRVSARPATPSPMCLPDVPPGFLDGLLVSEERTRLFDLLLAEPVAGVLWTHMIKDAYKTKGGDSYMRATADALDFLRQAMTLLADVADYEPPVTEGEESEGDDAGDA